MSEKKSNATLDSLAAQMNASEIHGQVTEKEASKWDQLPPLHLWHPDLSGEMDLTISKNGDWLYQGKAIKREKVIKLFSRIIRKEDDDYYLVTPVEKWKINVEDAPWVIVDVDMRPNSRDIIFTTNVGDSVALSDEHLIRVICRPEGEVPYIHIRNNLYARLNRQAYYKLSEYAQLNDDGEYVLVTNKGTFSLKVDQG